MTTLLRTLLQLNEAQELRRCITRGETPVLLTGLSGAQRTMLAAALARDLDRPAVFLCAEEKEARRIRADLLALTGEEAVLLSPREWQLQPKISAGRQWEQQRLHALLQMARGGRFIVTTAEAAAQRCIPKADLEAATVTLAVGERRDIAALCQRLTAMGYARCQQVEAGGQFSLRGGILDVFSPGAEAPVRCEFFDDEIDAMGVFDISTQRRTRNVEQALLLPAGEVLPHLTPRRAEDTARALEAAAKRLPKKEGAEALHRRLTEDAEALRQGLTPAGCDRYMAAVYPEMTTGFSYLPEDCLLFACEGGRIAEQYRAALALLREDLTFAADSGAMAPAMGELMLSEPELAAQAGRFAAVELEALPTGRSLLAPRALLQMTAKQLNTYGGSLDAAAADITHYLQWNYAVMVLCGGEVRCRNMERLLRERKLPAVLDLAGTEPLRPGCVTLCVGALSAGSEWPALKLAVLTEGQLTQSVSGKTRRPRPRQETNRQKLQSYTDLTPGDLVVHTHHGIGRFVEMLKLPVDGVEKDYIKIAYAGSDCLYVPCTALDLVSKYIGAAGEDPDKPAKLNRLGGSDWAKATHRARAAARELARGLINLYAQRQRQAGFAFSPDSPWQQEFEEAFPYNETPDQLRAVAEIKKDMERPVPMDRLLCGDVGYGKTEVALRAVMKCIMDGKQAAILVPTTVLAQQHYATAMSRFHGFPVTVEVLSRFRSPKQVKEVLERTAQGRVDLLIGTHKLLQKNVTFRDLGLLIIDEEQRFGVAAKESLREKARQVDTLTLSATPIPRTLNMALSGIRDMSSIEEPPADRQAVQTYVLEHDWGMVAEAIRRELTRGGQVYYLHNRVENIAAAAERLRLLLGQEVRIATAHGKMPQEQLRRVMQQMTEGEIQVLVCTTIIETGIDIPNVNTLIIEDADRMGLAQLHQIRGRIGRSTRRAYAYLTYRPGKVLTEVAAKRLTAIREYVEFGSGFKIAMRDLEIRGAGNLLGPEQSGYMMSVGYDMYLKLLNDAVLEQQGKAAEIRPECTADLTVSAYIPEGYVPAAQQRMDLYRRIAAIETSADAAEILDELLDRYGDVPPSVTTLTEVALLRRDAADCGVGDITQRGEQIVFSLGPQPDITALARVCALPAYRQRLRLRADGEPKLLLYLQPKENALQAARALINELRLHHLQRTPGPGPEEITSDTERRTDK